MMSPVRRLFVITCVRVAGACGALAGSSPLYEIEALPPRSPGVDLAGQHAAIPQMHSVGASRFLLPSPTDLSAAAERSRECLVTHHFNRRV
jgi:hypothetical protein